MGNGENGEAVVIPNELKTTEARILFVELAYIRRSVAEIKNKQESLSKDIETRVKALEEEKVREEERVKAREKEMEEFKAKCGECFPLVSFLSASKAQEMWPKVVNVAKATEYGFNKANVLMIGIISGAAASVISVIALVVAKKFGLSF